jgi:hypothetical protein
MIGLTSVDDDGIVVNGGRPHEIRGTSMRQPSLSLRLRDKLGPEGSQDLSHAFEEVQTEMLTITTERFEGRLAAVGSGLREDMVRMESGVRITLTEGLSKIRTDISEARANVVYWSFLFWIGQFAATAALIGYVLRWAGR